MGEEAMKIVKKQFIDTFMDKFDSFHFLYFVNF